MRINCEVTAVNRALAATACRQPRAVRATLGIGKAALGDNGSLCLHLCTATNKQGSKYKIMNNVAGVFTKFAHEGKFTVRLKEPRLDLIVKTDAVQAMSFLKLLKSCMSGEVPANLSSLAPAKAAQLTKPKTSLVVSSKQEYPITSDFPASLQHLTVTGCEMTRVDRRMLRLRRLQTLDLSHNSITELPGDLSRVACLTELSLPGNKLSRLPPHIFAGNISKSLRKLNLQDNQLQLLPASVCLLKNLVTLDVSKNKLLKLPFTLCRLRHLKYLLASYNPLLSLPLKLSGADLAVLELVGVPNDDSCAPDYIDLPPVLPLHELAARAVLRACGENLICLDSLPATLRHRLSYHVFCSNCSSPVVQCAAISETFCGGWDKLFSEMGSTTSGWSFRGARVSCSWWCFEAARLAAM